MDTDGGPRIKVVCRNRQYRAANKIVERLRSGATAMERSGVVWHTQGSGKSLTMVFLARMLRASPDLNDYKIVLVNDRQDLEEQLGQTATLIGGRVNVIESRQDLRRHLSADSSDINMVMVHKFQERRAPSCGNRHGCILFKRQGVAGTLRRSPGTQHGGRTACLGAGSHSCPP